MSDNADIKVNKTGDSGAAADSKIIIARADIQTYFFVTTGYCSGFIPCRSFAEKGSGKDDVKPLNRWIASDDNVVSNALNFANFAAQNGVGFFVIPGTVEQKWQARSADIMQMQSLLIDIDTGNTEEKLEQLTEHIGTPTLIVESGGITTEGNKKLHVYWQLSKAVEGENLRKLLELRLNVAKAVKGDEHFKSAHQPIRVAGSIYFKGGAKKLVVIRAYDPIEYELEELISGVDKLLVTTNRLSIAEVSANAVGNSTGIIGKVINAGNNSGSDSRTGNNSTNNRVGNTTHSSKLLDFNLSPKPLTIDKILTQEVYEGGEGENSRFACISRVVGYWLYLHHRGIIGMEEAVEAIRGYNLSRMNSPWPESRLNQTIKAIWELHLQKYGEVLEPLRQDEDEEDDNGLLELTDPTVYEGIPIPEREWIIEDWLPRGCVTALYGDGGIGKTLLVQELMTCVATGKFFLGQQPKPSVSWAIMCEDDLNELLRRQTKINDLYRLSMKDLGKVRFASRVSKNNLLITFSYGSVGQLTKFFNKLHRTVLAYKPDLIILDTASDLFGGNENARPEVRQFVQTACGKIATAVNAAVLLCAHPSESGILKGTGTGGSTAWNNSVRVRLYLKRPEGEHFNENHRVLVRVKSNYSSVSGAQAYFELEDSVLKELSKEEVSELINGHNRNKDSNDGDDRKTRLILRLVDSEAAAGRIYTANQFAERFEGKKVDGQDLGRNRSIRSVISAAAERGLIKFFEDPCIYGLATKKSAYGYLCRENTMLKTGETIDQSTGKITPKLQQVVPTHHKRSIDGKIIPIENLTMKNPNIWPGKKKVIDTG